MGFGDHATAAACHRLPPCSGPCVTGEPLRHLPHPAQTPEKPHCPHGSVLLVLARQGDAASAPLLPHGLARLDIWTWHICGEGLDRAQLQVDSKRREGGEMERDRGGAWDPNTNKQ